LNCDGIDTIVMILRLERIDVVIVSGHRHRQSMLSISSIQSIFRSA